MNEANSCYDEQIIQENEIIFGMVYVNIIQSRAYRNIVYAISFVYGFSSFF